MISLIENLSLIEHLGSDPEILKGSAVLVTAAAISGGVALVKMGISALGIGKKKKEKKAKEDALNKRMADVEAMEFTNAYKDISGASYDIEKAEIAKLGTANQLGDSKGYKPGEIGTAKGYTAGGYTGEGYTSEGYTAQGTNIGQLQRGANTGLTNTMNNLQVSTAAAEMQAQEADQALAASQDLAAQAGTGAGGATALAAAAAKSKQGVASSIDQQVKQNEMLRARGEGELQRAQLAQGNLASQFDLGQSQFNVGAVNQAAQFGAQSANQASQFGADARNQANRFTADAENQASRFKAQAQNQFAQAQFNADNVAGQFSAGQENQFSMANIASQNQFGLAAFGAENSMNQSNAANQTNANKYIADSQFKADQLVAGGDQTVQQMKYRQLSDLASVAGGQSAGANADLNQQRAGILGAAGGVADAVGNVATNMYAPPPPVKTDP